MSGQQDTEAGIVPRQAQSEGLKTYPARGATSREHVSANSTSPSNEAPMMRDIRRLVRDELARVRVQTIEIRNVTVDGYDAEHWRDCYNDLREAVVTSLDEFAFDDDVAEVAILVKAIEDAGAAIKLWPEFQRYMTTGGPREHGGFALWLEDLRATRKKP